jgi:hypothetical protein
LDLEILAIDEYNSGGHLVWAQQFLGAFVRGRTRQEAIDKFDGEMRQYLRWLGQQADGTCTVRIVQEKVSTLEISDADSDILFDSEAAPMTMDQYECLRDLALRSAADFLTLYRSVPDKDNTTLTPRKTFYGDVPITARQMYAHTKNVNGYYFGEIQVPAQNEPDILTAGLQHSPPWNACPAF